MSLVIDRAVGSSFTDDGPAKICIYKIRGKRSVKVQIDAPRSTSILRDDANTREPKGADCRP